MAIHTQLPIHKTGSELLGLVARIHAQMPRGYKRSVGDKIIGHCSEMLDLMALANATKNEQRAKHIQDILKHNRAATVWLRVGFDLRAVSTEPWSKSIQMLDNVGKQASGWLNKTREKAPAA
ncbi:MAG: four helix bundle protein [Rhodocyclaceae bacterium]|nr:four helix bundle protein [Rhodocyclaceae bacterium]